MVSPVKSSTKYLTGSAADATHDVNDVVGLGDGSVLQRLGVGHGDVGT
jgi:hypothetical protein